MLHHKGYFTHSTSYIHSSVEMLVVTLQVDAFAGIRLTEYNKITMHSFVHSLGEMLYVCGVYYDVAGLMIVMQFMKNFNENRSMLNFKQNCRNSL